MRNFTRVGTVLAAATTLLVALPVAGAEAATARGTLLVCKQDVAAPNTIAVTAEGKSDRATVLSGSDCDGFSVKKGNYDISAVTDCGVGKHLQATRTRSGSTTRVDATGTFVNTDVKKGKTTRIQYACVNN